MQLDNGPEDGAEGESTDFLDCFSEEDEGEELEFEPSMAERALAQDEGEVDRIPASCFCSLTHEIMRDPVMLCSGHSYERSAIDRWLSEGRRTDPITNLPLQRMNSELVTNHTLRKVASNAQDIHMYILYPVFGEGLQQSTP
jgi:hypothetical protein